MKATTTINKQPTEHDDTKTVGTTMDLEKADVTIDARVTSSTAAEANAKQKQASFARTAPLALAVFTCGIVLFGVGFGSGYAVRDHAPSAVTREYIGELHIEGEYGERLHGKAIQTELDRMRAAMDASTETSDVVSEFKQEISFTLGRVSEGARRRLSMPIHTVQPQTATVTMAMAESFMEARGIIGLVRDLNHTAPVRRKLDEQDTTTAPIVVATDEAGAEVFYQCEGEDCYELQLVYKDSAHGRRMSHLTVGDYGAAGQVWVWGCSGGPWGCLFTSIFFVVYLSTDGFSSCLPADAVVTAMLAVGAPPQAMPIAQVPHGAMVLSTAGFSPIYLYSHYTENAVSWMSRIETRSGHAVELSNNHYLRACISQRGCSFTTAKNIAPGMSVELLAKNGTVVMSEVTAARVVAKKGLFNPHTLAGDIIASVPDEDASDIHGIVVSDASEWFAEGYVPEAYIPALYHSVLSPVRQLFRLNPAWLTRFHDRTVKLLEEADDGKSEDVRSRAVAGSLDMLGAYEIAKSAALTGIAGLPWASQPMLK